MNIAHIAQREGTDTDTDPAITVCVMQFLIGFVGVTLQFLKADELNLQYVKHLFKLGVSIEEADAKLWGWYALGTSVESRNNLAGVNIEKARSFQES